MPIDTCRHDKLAVKEHAEVPHHVKMNAVCEHFIQYVNAEKFRTLIYDV